MVFNNTKRGHEPRYSDYTCRINGIAINHQVPLVDELLDLVLRIVGLLKMR